MIVYVDSSVLLRVLLREPAQVCESEDIQQGIASALIEVECLGTLDRLRLTASLTPEEVVERRVSLFQLLEALELVEISRSVLRRAAESFATPLGTLDAIHLATALLWREHRGSSLAFATHDGALALAARASGLPVIGA